MTSGPNIFMDRIIDKVTPTFKNYFFSYRRHKKDVKKFKDDIRKGSPSFNLLWQMANFIKISEYLFFYNNSMKESKPGIYSSHNYKSNENGFKVNTSEVVVIVKLIHDSKRVMVEITRNSGNNMRTTMTFENNEWLGEPSDYDVVLLDRVIEIINIAVLDLFDECYEKM